MPIFNQNIKEPTPERGWLLLRFNTDIYRLFCAKRRLAAFVGFFVFLMRLQRLKISCFP